MELTLEQRITFCKNINGTDYLKGTCFPDRRGNVAYLQPKDGSGFEVYLSDQELADLRNVCMTIFCNRLQFHKLCQDILGKQIENLLVAGTDM